MKPLLCRLGLHSPCRTEYIWYHAKEVIEKWREPMHGR